jgi:hypothetical protein
MQLVFAPLSSSLKQPATGNFEGEVQLLRCSSGEFNCAAAKSLLSAVD